MKRPPTEFFDDKPQRPANRGCVEEFSLLSLVFMVAGLFSELTNIG